MKNGWSIILVMGLLLGGGGELWGHHFKGLPHYNYFENYPQVPEEEYLGQVGDYELSLVVYDFQGIQKEATETPDNVRLFLVLFNLRDNRVYKGALTLEILDRDQAIAGQRFEHAELENLYSLHRELSEDGKYAIRVVLHDEGELTCLIPFRLSSQKVHWGKWVAVGMVLLLGVTAAGARKARVAQDRREARNHRPGQTQLGHGRKEAEHAVG